MVAAGKHLQPGVGQLGGQPLAHGHRAEWIGVAPQQQHRHHQRRQLSGEVGCVGDEPIGQLGMGGLEALTLILGAHGGDRQPSRGGAEHQMGNPLRPGQGGTQRQHPTHRLSDYGAGSIEPLQHQGEQIVESVHPWIAGRVPNAWPAQKLLLSSMSQPLGQWLPEARVAGSAGQKLKTLRRLGHGMVHGAATGPLGIVVSGEVAEVSYNVRSLTPIPQGTGATPTASKEIRSVVVTIVPTTAKFCCEEPLAL